MGIKTSVLFSLTLLDKILREFRDPGGFVSFNYENLYGFVPPSYKRKNLYGIMRILKNNKDINMLKQGSFCLSEKGETEAVSHFPLLGFLGQPWDGKWRILGFDIEEKQRSLRDKLRRSLHRFGFGMLQKSVYISPLAIEQDISNFLSANRDLLQNTYIFVSNKFFVEDQPDFIDRIFHISALNNAYKVLLEKITSSLSKEEKAQVIREFLEISAKDPFLPKELLPKDFARGEAWQVLKEKGVFQ